MQDILLAQATAGMTLAKDVLSPEGRILCGKGTVLDDSLIPRLSKMEILHITVEGHPVNTGNEKSLEQEILEIEARFSKVTNISPLMYLKKRIIEKAVSSRSQ